jgi:hypothetical protein
MTSSRPALVLLLGVACTPEAGVWRTETDTYEQVAVEQTDVLVLADGSPSNVANEQALIGALLSLIGVLGAADVDYHIGAVSCDLADPSAGTLATAYLTPDTVDPAAQLDAAIPTTGLASEREQCLAAGALAVSSPLVETANAGFLRDGVATHVLVVSDEDDCSGPEDLEEDGSTCVTRASELGDAAALAGVLTASDADGVVISGVLPSADACGVDAPRYEEVVRVTGGSRADLCTTDLASFLALTLGPQTERYERLQLSRLPDPATIEVTVDELVIDEGAEDGWTYDPGENQLVFHGEAIPPRGAWIYVRYQTWITR